MTELLSPAGDFECFKQALYNGADAIYLATDRFGARAYAKNLTLDELKKALIFAHSLNKKVYVTVNTIIKESELLDAKNYCIELYKLGVDGLILADYSLINFVNDNLKPMEAHISTQVGIKDLNDVKFFEKLGVDRCVLARELSIDEIKNIKNNSKMPLEVFSYGALCVSYSGGCLFSSLLTLRSGNRGRCSQNCRREYKLFKNDELLDKGFMLSMKDLNTFNNLNELLKINVDSLKIEGRMKSPEYVKLITNAFRNKIDNLNYKSNDIDTVFHRAYTKGFIFNEDKGNIVDINKKSNEGALIGTITGYNKNLTKIHLNRPLNINDRIRIEGKSNDYYFTIDDILDSNMKHIKNGNNDIYLNIYEKREIGEKIYKMTDSSIDLSIDTLKKCPIDIIVYGEYGEKLKATINIGDEYFEAESDMILDKAKNSGIDYNTLYKQLSKLNDTPYYLNNLESYLNENLFITISEINNLRRKLVSKLDEYFQHERKEINIKDTNQQINNEITSSLNCFCNTLEQYEECKKLGIKNIYYKNYSPYVNSKYQDVDEDYVLVGNYGGINKYHNKYLISDYSFNVINSEAIYNLEKRGVKRITISPEASLDNIKDLYNGYLNKYKNKPNLEMIVYGKLNLMTLKYCPLKRYNECGKCNQNKYVLKDEIGTFEIYHNDCITHIINSKPLNLIDDLDKLNPYISNFRLQFTNESKDEVNKIINEFKEKINNNSNKKYFDSKNNTRGYLKREIL